MIMTMTPKDTHLEQIKTSHPKNTTSEIGWQFLSLEAMCDI